MGRKSDCLELRKCRIRSRLHSRKLAVELVGSLVQRLNASLRPDIRQPTLMIEYTGDNSVFPADAEAIFGWLGSGEKRAIASTAIIMGNRSKRGRRADNWKQAAEFANGSKRDASREMLLWAIAPSST